MVFGEPLRQLWFNSPQPEICPRGTTHEEEQEGCLSVLDPWDALEQGGVFSALCLQEIMDEIGLADGDSKYSKALLVGRQVRAPSPHNFVWPHLSCPKSQFRVGLPWWTWMCSWVESSSSTMVCASETLSSMLAM